MLVKSCVWGPNIPECRANFEWSMFSSLGRHVFTSLCRTPFILINTDSLNGCACVIVICFDLVNDELPFFMRYVCTTVHVTDLWYVCTTVYATVLWYVSTYVHVTALWYVCTYVHVTALWYVCATVHVTACPWIAERRFQPRRTRNVWFFTYFKGNFSEETWSMP